MSYIDWKITCLGFLRSETNSPVQPQNLARWMKFLIKTVENLHYISSEKQRR